MSGSLQGIFAILGAIVTVALITTVVMRPNSATVIGALGNAFSGSLTAAMGR